MGQNSRDDSNASTPPDKPHDIRHIALTGNRLDSGDLFLATREIIIAHGDEHYRLRLTAQNKLILTK
jgi:hemin uptake protein HemP